MTRHNFTFQQLMDWCDKKAAEGAELAIKWDGGNDSGWVHFEVDGADCNEPEAECLVDMMYDQLDYGSWAGDFSADGEAIYNAETKVFEGIDYYNETEYTKASANIEIRVPKHIPFATLAFQTDGEDVSTSVQFDVRNSFVHPDTNAIQVILEEHLHTEIEKAINEDLKVTRHEYEGCYGDYTIPREDFKVDGDELVHVLTLVDYSFFNTTERSMIINLAELLEEEDNK